MHSGHMPGGIVRLVQRGPTWDRASMKRAAVGRSLCHPRDEPHISRAKRASMTHRYRAIVCHVWPEVDFPPTILPRP